MNTLKRFKAWRENYDDNFELLETEKSLFNEVERILEKAEKNSCEGCKYSGDASFNGMKACTECCNNYYNKWMPKPKKTRFDKFRESFPTAELTEFGTVSIVPCDISEEVMGDEPYRCARNKKYGSCNECRKAYWNEEVE